MKQFSDLTAFTQLPGRLRRRLKSAQAGDNSTILPDSPPVPLACDIYFADVNYVLVNL